MLTKSFNTVHVKSEPVNNNSHLSNFDLLRCFWK